MGIEMKNKTYSLTIYMLKPDITDVADTVKDPMSGFIDIKLGSYDGKLFYKQNPTRPPGWVKLFKPIARDTLNDLYNTSTSAVLLILVERQFFALTFGYGRSILKTDCFEENFGLRMVLNSVDPEKINSVDSQSLGAIPFNQRNQASIASPMSGFGIDIEQDIICAATGHPKDSAFGKKLTGKDALKISIPMTAEDIPALLTKLKSQYEEKTYMETFAWIDNLKEVRQNSDIYKLDAELTKKIQSHNFERTWLSIPEIIDWSDMSGFKYQSLKHSDPDDDIRWETYLEFLDNETPTIEAFRKHQVHAISASSELTSYTWTVYRCIYCELSLDGSDYALNNGKWYKVNVDFLNTLNESIKQIPISTLPLPEYTHNSEADYNKSVYTQNPEYFTLLDRKNITYGGNNSKIELCDLFTSDKHLIHVKRYGGSSVLSHLFSQGVVSARLLLSDRDFRKKINEILPDSHKLKDENKKPAAEEFEVIYAIASNRASASPELPLFSKISLRNSYTQLQTYGMKASLQYVQVQNKKENVAAV
jgi:uncharacterized protein (TIGR04141 family)